MPWSINTIPVPHGMAAAVTGSSSPRSAAAASALGPGVSPSLSISSIPPTSSVVGSLNISPSTGGGGGASNNKKGFVKTSGNISKSSGDSGVTGGGGGVAGGHVMDHHSSRAGPTDVIGLSAAAASRNGVASMAHYDHYLPPPSAAQILVAEELRRARMERIIMADRELEGEQQLRMQQQQQHQHQQRERQEQEMDLIRQLGQQRASYYGQAQANVSIYILLIIAKDQCFRIVGIPGQSSSCLCRWSMGIWWGVLYTQRLYLRDAPAAAAELLII